MAKSQYDWVFDAYSKWVASRADEDYKNLWLASQSQMRMIVFKQARKLSRQLDYDDLIGIVDDSTINVIEFFKQHNDIKYHQLYSIFGYQNKKAFQDFNRKLKKYNKSKIFSEN